MMETITLNAANVDSGKRLDVFVCEYTELTRNAVQKLIEKENVFLNGNKANKKDRLCEGDTVEITIDEPTPCDAIPQNIPIDIVYEDNDVIIVNKPKGMVVHPAPGNPDGTLVNALLYHTGSRLSGINGVIRPGIVHRIDKDTSGLLMVAKNDAAHVFLAQQIKDHSFSRTYHTIAFGNIKEDEFTVDKPIGRHPVDRKKMAVVDTGKEAFTSFKVLERFNGYTYLEATLKTGRTHQIRVHLSSVGHSVLGDTVYNKNKNKIETENAKLLCGQCLHAKTIGFVHPTTHEFMHFDSELPEYFKKILQKFNNMV